MVWGEEVGGVGRRGDNDGEREGSRDSCSVVSGVVKGL